MSEITTTDFIATYEQIIEECKEKMGKCYRFERKEKDKIARPVACDLGWYDWFCNDRALIGRTERYGKTVCSIIKAVPELAEGTQVGFSQRYGNGYVDFICISPVEGSDLPYGYGIRINPPKDREDSHRYNRQTGRYETVPGEKKYYVYRDDRAWGGDFECDSVREIIAFIKNDIRLWKAGYTTKEYDRGKDTSACAHYITMRTNVPYLA